MYLGNGTTLQCVIDNIKNGVLQAKINLVVSDNKDAYALKRAEENNIPIYIIKSNALDEIDIELESILKNYDINLIVLARIFKINRKKINK